MGTAVPTEVSGRQHHQAITKMKAFVAVMALAGASATPAADPALLYAGHPAVGGVVGVAPVVGTVDTGLKFHPASGAVTPDFTEAQKEAAPELAANQKPIKHLAYTGHVVQSVHPIHTTSYLYGKREAEAEPAAEAEADPLLYTTGVHHVAPVVTAPVVAPAVYTQGGLVAHPDGAVTPDYTPAQKVAAATHLAAKGIHPVFHTGAYLYGKRDAEAKPDAWSVYGYPGVYTGAYGYPYGGVYHYGKRDAEAESDAWGVYGYPSVYTGAYGYPYGGVYHYGKRDAEAKPDAWGVYGYPTVYSGAYGYPYGGVYHYGKRDAEAKADAWGVYGYGYPTVHAGYPYAYGHVYGK